MKKEIIPSLVLTIICILFFSGFYPLLILGIAQFAPGNGKGINTEDGKYYTNVVQSFTQDKYFWPRPSAVSYNAAGSGGSNKGPTNPDYLASVQQRIDTFLAHNPTVKKSEISSDMVTASGSGLDPHISVQGALIQVDRIAMARNIPVTKIKDVVTGQIEGPLMGIFGPEKINVLKLNIQLDKLK